MYKKQKKVVRVSLHSSKSDLMHIVPKKSKFAKLTVIKSIKYESLALFRQKKTLKLYAIKCHYEKIWLSMVYTELPTRTAKLTATYPA